MLLISEQIYEMDVCILMCLQCKWLKDIFYYTFEIKLTARHKDFTPASGLFMQHIFNSSLIHIFSFFYGDISKIV